MILDVDGIFYPSARTFPTIVDSIGHGFLGLVSSRNRFTRSYRMLDVGTEERRIADWVSGACFLARREAFDQVGGFDPAFFMFSEDVDLCWRIGRAGWKIAYEPAATVTHVQGVSRAHHPYRMVVEHHRALLLFASRTTEGPARLLLPVVAAGLVVRALAVMARTALGRPPV
jgi:N-acetylglucosaminyl-diphospho-decaprenol L-rhamnosyltransferase